MSELARNGEWDSSESATGFRAGGMVLQFADGAIAACNPVAAELLGYTADELIGKRWFDSPRQFIHRDGSTFLPEENPALVALRTGQPCSNVTVGCYRCDGELLWLRLDLQPLFRANESAPYAVVTTIADVTAQNRQAIARSSQPETMQTSEANLRLFIKYAPVCIAMFDRNMNYVALSQRWAEIYQLDSVEAVLGRSHYEVFPQIGDRWKQAHQRGLAGEIQQSEEDSFILPDGTIQWLRWEIRPWYAEKGEIGGIVIFVEDISDRKRTEAEQRKNEQRYRALIELSPQLVFMSDPNGSIIYCNQWGLEFTGRSLEQLTGDGWADLVRPDHRDRVYQAWKTATTQVSDYEIEAPYRRADGVYRWLYTRALPVRDDNGKIAYWIGVALDISDRKQAEQELQQTNQTLRTLIQSSPLPIVAISPNANVRMWNKAATEVFGWSEAEVLNRPIPIVPPDQLEECQQLRDAVANGQTLFGIEAYRRKQDGSKIIVSISAAPVYGNSGSIDEIMLIFQDISDRKQAEAALRDSELRYRMLFESMDQGFCVCEMLFDRSGAPIDYRFLEVNPAFEQMTGLQGATGKTALQLVPNLEPFWVETYGRVALTGQPARFENQSEAMNMWFEVSAFRVGEPENHKFAILFTNISDRKITEANLRENEARLFLVQQATRSGVWDWDVVANCAYVSEEYCALMGFDLAGKTVSYEEWASRIHPEDRALASEKVARAIAQNQPYIDEYRVVHRQGVRWIRSSGQVYYDQTGQPVRMIGLLQDVSDRKSAEIALQQSEERLSLAIDSAGMATWDINMPTGKGIWSQSHFPMLGYEPIPGGAATYEMWQSRVHPDDLEAVMQALEVAQQTRSLYSREYRIIRADNGEIRWLRGFGRFFYDKNGQAVRFIGILFDTSDRQVAEQSLRESEERLRLGMQVAGFALAKFDYASNTVELSPEAAALYGLPADELVVPRSRIHATFHPEEREEMAKLIEQVLDPSGAGWFSRDHRVVWGNGEVRWLTVRKQVFFDRAGKTPRPTHAILAAIDISDRKQAELALTESESRFRHMADNAPFMVWVTDATGYCHYLSQSWYDFSGQTPETGLGLGWLNVVHPEDRENSKNIFLAANARCEGFRLEYRLRRKDGEYIWAIDAANPWFGADGQFKGYIGSVIDISDRKQAELALQESESRFRTLADNIAQLAWMTDSNGWIFWYNQRWFDYTGTTLAEMQGWGWQKVHHPDHLERVVEHFRQCLKTGEPWEDTFPLRGKDGNYRWFLSRAIPIRDEQGNVVRWFGTNTDISDRKQTEDALSESEERLRLALNAANQGLYDLNLQTGDAIVSPEYAQMLGYDPENFQETNAFWLQRLHPDDLQRTNQVYQDYIAGRLDQYQVEFRQRTKQGDWKWILSTGSIVAWDKDGNPLRMLGIHTDISDRKQAEEALRQSNAILNTINESTPTLIYVKDREGRMVVANPALLAVVGKSAQAILGKTSLEFHQPREEGEKIMENDRLVMQTGQSHQFEEAVEMVGGWRVYLSVKAPYRDEQGNIIGIIGISSDISDRKQAELERERLLARERQYTEQLQGLTAAALAINAALSVQEVLQAITDRAAAIVGTHQSVTSVTVNDNWAQSINAVYLSDKYAQWRGYDAKPDGSGIYACVCHLNRPMRMTQAELEADPHWRGFGKHAENHPPMRGWLAAPLVGRDGQNIGLIQLSDKYEGDFTETDEAVVVQLAQMASIAVENARLYEAEQQAREEAQTANRLKDEFLAVLSHELRSPLNPILGWTKLLQTGKLNGDRTAEALTTIERNAKLQAQLIEDLLDISRVMRGKLTLNSTRVNLSFVISNAIETVRLAAEAKNIQFHLALDATVGEVLGDAGRLQQVVWNLLSNAVKFTPVGGQVTIRLTQIDAEAQIQIIDTGKGINPEFLPYVFEYFRQEDGSTTRKFGGLGLGLAIARQIVEMHGGRIWADSPGIGFGATFTVKLPVVNGKVNPASSRAIAASTPSAPTTPLTGMRILVVDDTADTRELLTFLLEANGAIVLAVDSAAEALQTFAEFQPDIILSDIGMPEMDGYELMRSLRRLEVGKSIPAIALTAYAGEIDREQAIAAGFQRHIAKPIDPDRVISYIIELVQ